MKVKDLLKELNKCKKQYPDFLEWDIYTEQCTEFDKEHKRKLSPPKKKQKELNTLKDIMDAGYGQGWGVLTDSEGWEYFRCVGFNTKFPKKKAFTINVNY